MHKKKKINKQSNSYFLAFCINAHDNKICLVITEQILRCENVEIS